MREFDNKQKRIIKWTLISLILVIAIGISITWLVFTVKDWNGAVEQVKSLMAWLFANFGSLIIGIVTKIVVSRVLNNKAKFEMEKLHEEYGLNKIWDENHKNANANGNSPRSQKNLSKPLKNEYYRVNDIVFCCEKGQITIYYNSKGQVEDYKNIKYALGELVEQMRKDLPTQLI